jgi:radical SAM protein with 4Fe4S-binding SPASM domain
VNGVLDELAEAGTLQLILTGGEPALRSDLADIIRAARDRHFAVCLKSNGTLLDESKLRLLWDNGLSSLHVSLYHVDAREHDEFVGLEGAWQRTVNCIDQFESLGGKIRVSIVAMNWNASSVLAVEKLCIDRGWEYGIDLRLVIGTDGSKHPIRYRASDADLLRILASSPAVDTALPRERRKQSAKGRLCGIGDGPSVIKPNGDVWPCLLFPLSLGNIREARYENIWLNSEMRKDLLRLRWDDKGECANCSSFAFCYRCPAVSYLETGDARQPAPIDCRLAAIREKAWRAKHGE